ncbi:MAG TPA: dihydrodipicolinate synthase family protein [Verrucomicrobiae bacterium]|nr:dihydrodipicolinate synthase family protein [Verrucomicrobiae bacterium]
MSETRESKKPAATSNSAASPGVFRGIIPPMITPLRDRDTLDVEGLQRLVEHLIAGGVHGIFALGTTGEAPSLSHRLRQEVVRATLDFARQRVPVLVGITDTSFTESVELASLCATAGAAGVVTAPPYYFPAGQPELCEYLDDLAAELPLPLFLYNMPSMTKVSIELSTVQHAMRNPKVIGIKDSSGDMIHLHRLVELSRQRPDSWSVLIGPEELTAEAVLLGAHGGVNGGANVHPRLYVQLYEAATAGDLPRIRELQRQVLDLAGQLYTVGRHRSSLIKGVKCALNLLGICHDGMAEPFRSFREPERAIVRERLIRLGLLNPRA